MKKVKRGLYHLRIGADIEGEDCGCEGAQEIWAVPHRCQVGHVVIEVTEKLHQCDRVFPEPRAFFFRLPGLHIKYESSMIQECTEIPEPDEKNFNEIKKNKQMKFRIQFLIQSKSFHI